jgi:predicted ribosomally synthesized peptide with SipW-like signal peptide
MTTSTIHPPRQRRFSTSTVVRTVLALGTVLGIGTVLTLAAWTDDGAAEATFSTGNVDITLDGNQANPTANEWANLSASGMGDGTSKYSNLLIANAGTLPFGYQLGVTNASGDASLYAALRVSATAVPDGTVCDAFGLSAGAGKTVLFTDVAFSATAFPTTRPLAGGTQETICFRVSLPSGSASTLQSKTAVANFLFTATQS